MKDYTKARRAKQWKSKIFDIYMDMIIIKGEDKTGAIVSFGNNQATRKYDIKFEGGEEPYHYNYNNVTKLRNPMRHNVTKEIVYSGSKIHSNVKCLLQFNSKTRLIYENGEYDTVDSSSLRILENGLQNQTVEGILEYFKEIVRIDMNSGGDRDIKKDLADQLDNITYIHPDSVLYSYLTHGPIKEREIDLSNVIYPFNFNLSQKAALENALTHSISIIQGPPGTGKTQTILNILANLVAVQHKTVAVVSNNNDAVINVKDKMANAGYGFLTALLGNKHNEELFFGNMVEVPSLDNWNCSQDMETLFRENERLSKRLNDLLKVHREKKKKEQELQRWQTEQKHFEEYYSRKMNTGGEIQIPLFCRTPDEILTFLAENAVAQEANRFFKFIYRLKLIFKYRMKRGDMPTQQLLITLQKRFYVLQIEKTVNEISAMEHQLEQDSFDNLLKEYQKVSEVLFRNYLYLSHNGWGTSDFTIDNYKSRYREFIGRYPVILSATQSVRKSLPYSGKSSEIDFLLDYVIIDESSQVDLIRGILAFSCCKNVIIVGDEKQLPQIVNMDIEKNLQTVPAKPEYNYFKENIISSMRMLYGEELPCTTLLEHYRCHPKIIEFCNQRYYDGKLIACTSSDTREEPLILYKTSKGNHMRRITEGREKGRYNQRELDVIKEIIGDLDLKDADVGVVAPYKLQVERARKELGENFECDTVHKYQGREKEIIIMTTVLDSTKDGQRGIDFVDSPNMINVAVSRAQKQFILDTDHDLFFYKGKEISALIRYIQYSNPGKSEVESKIVSVFDLLYKEYSRKLLPLRKKMLPQAKYESEEVIRVLLVHILGQEKYNMYTFDDQVCLCNLIAGKCGDWKSDGLLDQEEYNLVDHNSSVDFVITDKMDKHCIMAIEVDGFAYRENKVEQRYRDKLKDSILEKYNIPILRLKTNGSGEKEKIENALDVIKRREELKGEQVKEE